MKIGTHNFKHALLTVGIATLTGMTFSLLPSAPAGAGDPSPSPPSPVSISSIPLSVVVPTHPQVMIALSNSNSMDSSDNIIDDSTPSPGAGTHAPTSAIMTWSGHWGASPTSPSNYTVPAGYTAPVTGASSGSAAYTAAINTFDRTTTRGGGWTCSDYVDKSSIYTHYIPFPGSAPSIPPAGSNPGWYHWPVNPPVPWNPSVRWYFNNVDTGGNGGYYQQYSSPPPPLSSAIHKIASPRQWFHGSSDLLARNGHGGLASVGMGIGPQGNKPVPRLGGGSPPGRPAPPCTVDCPAPPPPQVCVTYMWTPQTTQTSSETPYGDNSASRLNIAKESIAQVIQGYDSQIDFGLMTYKVTGAGSGYSWAYYMSPPGGFSLSDFSNTYQTPTYAPGATSDAPPAITSQWVINPCWNNFNGNNNYNSGPCNTLLSKVNVLDSSLSSIAGYEYMRVANRSDDPGVDDVFVTNAGIPHVFATYGTPTAPSLAPAGSTYNPGPALTSPYISFDLNNYNLGEPGNCALTPGSQCVVVEYPNTVPSIPQTGAFYVTPTNAGFVPYSTEVLFSFRGQLWQGTPDATTGQVLAKVQAPASLDSTDLKDYYSKFAAFLTPENDMYNYGDDTANVPNITPAISYYHFYTQAIYASAAQAPTAGMLSTALDTSNWPAAAISAAGCPTPRYVILITDGLPTLDQQGKTWPPPGSAAAAGYGVTVAANGDGTITTNDQAVTDTITEITALNQAGIKTFVVGMGPGVDPSLNPQAALVLQAMAVAGGTQNYLAATSPAAVVHGLGAIINKITSTNVAAVSGAVNSTGLNTSTTLYQASYTGYAPQFHDWTGDLQAFPVESDGTVSTTANWSAQCELDKTATGGTCGPAGGPGTGTGWQSRIIATCGHRPGEGCDPGSGEPFEWNDLHGQMDNALRIIPGDHGTGPGKERLDYLRGDTSNEQVNGGPFRNRSHILGDIVDSGTLYVAAPSGPYGGMTGYNQFVSDNQSRTPMIYVGANDGMLHAFNAATGKEAFAFVPNGVFANLIDLTKPGYHDNHQFFVDGTPTAGDVQFANGSWHTLLAGGLNDGGKSIYALDVTDPSDITSQPKLAQRVLWEFTGPHMGLSYSQPAFARTSDTASQNANPSGFLVFFGSGYNNSDQNPYLYALNPETGQIVSKDVSQAGAPLGPINLCAAVSPDPCNHNLANGLSGVTVVNDNGVMGAPATTVYAGDLQGHLWKVDISSANPANWTVTLLFSAKDASGNLQPITDTPVVSLNPQYPGATGTVVYFGTGQYLGSPDINNTDTQSFYGVLDNGVTSDMTRSDLVQQTISATSEVINGVNETVRTITSNAVDWSTQKGWFIDLPLPGERVITNPQLYSGEVVFTTYVPSPAAASTCSYGGQSFLMVLNYKNGGEFPKPQIDLNNDGKLNHADQIGALNPVGLSMGQVFASAPVILSASLGDNHAVKLMTLSSGGFRSVAEAGGTPPKITWTQLN